LGKIYVAVLGAGPAALYLKLWGHQVDIFEPFEKADTVSSGLMIQRTSMTGKRFD
jgi:2-polyprenyl-6-methoxyphenol hydroxylase-like FAD-dependent oxidoreductase